MASKRRVGTQLTEVVSGGAVATNGANIGDVQAAVGTALTFTTGSVMFAGLAGSLAQDNANFFWDDTNNRLGIGTNTPTSDLHISRNFNGGVAAIIANPSTGASAAAFFNAQSGAGTATCSMGMTGTSFVNTGATPNLGSNTAVFTTITPGPTPTVYIGSAGVITFQTGSPAQAERLRILATGQLQVSSLAASGLVKSAITTGQLSVATAGTDYLAPVSALTTGSVLFAGAAGAVAQDNSNFFWDDTNNRLGIGTNTPASALDVSVVNASIFTSIQVRNTSVATAAIGAQFFASNGTQALQMGVMGSAATALSAAPNMTSGVPFIQNFNTTGQALYIGSRNDITFQTGTTQVERMRILSSGELQVSSLNLGGLIKSAITSGQLSVATAGTDYINPNATTGSILLGRGSSGAGVFQEITLGTNLSMVGTTLNATGSGGSPVITLTAGAGLIGGGDTTVNRTFAVGANIDGTILVNADDIQVGTIHTGNIANGNVTFVKIEPLTSHTVLGSDGDGTGNKELVVVAPLHTDVGSGQLTFNTGFTTGSVVFMGASQIAQDNVNFFWDDTNNRLGIGTNTPAVPLDVVLTAANNTGVRILNTSPATTVLSQFNASNGTAGTIFGVTGTGYTAGGSVPNLAASQSFITTTAASTVLYVGSAGNITFQTGTTQAERLRILSTGQLQVSSLNAGGIVSSAVTTGQLSVVTFAPGQIAFGAAAGGGLAQDTALVWDAATDRLGIGTTSPNSSIDITKNANTLAAVTIGNSNAGALSETVFNLSNGSLNAGFGLTGTGWTTTADGLAANTSFWTSVGGLYLGSNTDISLWTGTSTLVKRLNVTTAGNVQISSLASSGVIQSAAGTGQLGAFPYSGGNIPFGLSGLLTQSSNFTFTSSSNHLGIGTSSPLTAVDAVGADSGFTTIAVTNTSTGTGAGGTFSAKNSGTQSSVTGITSTGWTSPGILPNLPADTVFFSNGATAGTALVYIGSFGALTFQTGNPQQERLSISASGTVSVNGTLGVNDIQSITGRSAGSWLVGTSPVWAIQATVDAGPSNPKIGFFSATPATKPTVSGSRATDAWRTSVMSALSSLGLVTDSTSA